MLSLFPPSLDIDECRNKSHTCDVNAVCSNTQGSYNCTCKPGYSGDGKKCIGIQYSLLLKTESLDNAILAF